MNRNTSSAVDYDIFEDVRLARVQREKELEQIRQQKLQKQAKLSAKNRMRTICTILVVFAVACTVLHRNAVIIQSVSKINALMGDLDDAKSENIKNELALEKSVDLTYIEEVATRKLGMKRPDKFQTVYVDVTQSNYAEVMNASNNDENFHGAFSVIRQGALNVLEYLQ